MNTHGVSRAEFARVMGVDAAQATRWAQRGMPTNEDGTVPAGEAAEWVRRNVRDYRRVRHSKGAQQLSAAEHDAQINDFARLPLSVFAHQMPDLAARLALAAGIDVATAQHLYRLMQTGVAELANVVVTDWCSIGHGENGPWETVGGPPFEPDWAAALAAEAGVTAPQPPRARRRKS